MATTTRYAVYAAAAMATVAAYVALDDPVVPADQGMASASAGQRLSLPVLTSASGADSAEVKRDLFNVVQPPPPEPPPVVAVAAEPPPPPAPPPPDRLSQLKVIGVVSRGPKLAILVEVGDEVETVVAGQQFGADAALKIDGIQENRVLVTDSLANVTRTFTLSEE
ncbi:MAG: hypothetical protein Q7T86_16920 [Hyphomicrobiaceae bacterium]|nr:hypothetical protein [Hyphomicrobiaceae bacterium]